MLPSSDSINVAEQRQEAQSHHYCQHILVMRHGDRIDNFEPLWLKTAPRQWDPPLFKEGWIRAFDTGKKLRAQLGFPIHRIFVSPFLRCIQTASQVTSALCSLDDSDLNAMTNDDMPKIKVSIEYGLSEIMNDRAIWHPPKDDQCWEFDISEIEASLPANTVDSTVRGVVKELPQWGETQSEAWARYLHTIQSLADKYASENLLLVTHAEGVMAAASTFLKDAIVGDVGYCGYAALKRKIIQTGNSFDAEEFEFLTDNYGQIGMKDSPPCKMDDSALPNDP